MKTRRRLLMIVPRVTTGGADKFNLDLVAQLRKREWEITAVTTLPGDNSWAPRLAEMTSDIFILDRLLRPSDYPRFFRYIIESRRPDAVLVSNSVFAYRALPYLRRLAQGTAIVDYCHSIHPAWLNGGYPRLSVEQSEYLDLQIASSEALKDWMIQEGATLDRVEVCYTNAEPPEDEPALLDANSGEGLDKPSSQLKLSLPDELPVIIYPCRVDVEKQPRVFGKTVLELHQRGHRFSALVVGDGAYLDWLQRFVRQHGMQEYVRFLGRQPSDEARRLISVSDCLFLPSQFEGISLTFFEAMAEGVPVVGADVGGQRELVTSECGVLVERGDEESEVARYAQVLGDLLDHPEKRLAMGEAGKRRIRDHFQLDDMGSTMDNLLEHARALARTRPRRTPSAEQANAAALGAVRELAWAFPGASTSVGGPLAIRLRRRLFRLGATIGMPIHRIGIRLGLHWIDGWRQYVANLLQPR